MCVRLPATCRSDQARLVHFEAPLQPYSRSIGLRALIWPPKPTSQAVMIWPAGAAGWCTSMPPGCAPQPQMSFESSAFRSYGSLPSLRTWQARYMQPSLQPAAPASARRGTMPWIRECSPGLRYIQASVNRSSYRPQLRATFSGTAIPGGEGTGCRRCRSARRCIPAVLHEQTTHSMALISEVNLSVSISSEPGELPMPRAMCP